MTKRLKNIFSFFFCFILSVGLLMLLFSRIDFKQMWQDVKGADIRYMIAAGVVFFSTNILILWRWRILMKALGLKAKRFSSVRWFSIGLFCNLLPLSSVGGDVVRGLGLSQETGYKPKVFASIVLDRLSGFAGLVILAAVAFFFGRAIVQNKFVFLAIIAMSAVSLVIAIVLFSHRIFPFACNVFSVWPRLKNGLMSLHYDIVLLKGKQKQGWEAVGISILAQIIFALEFYLTAQGMHQHISFVYFIIFSPIVCVVTSLPSIGGLGWREVGWVSLLSTVGVNREVASGLSLINSGFMFLVGLLGGLLYVTTLSAGRLQHYQTDAGLKPWHA